MRPNFSQYPFLVAWEMTHACLMACKHCRASAEKNPLLGELSTEQGKTLLDELSTFEPKPLVLMTGGDPLQRPDVFELIEHARARDLKIGFTPAASPALTRDIIVKLKEAGVTRLALSLDAANADLHDAFRGEPGTFERTMQALEWAREVGLPTQINTTVTRNNSEDIKKLPALMEEKGVVLWSVFYLVPVGRGQILKQLTSHQFEDHLHWLYDLSLTSSFHVKTTEAHHFRRVVMQERAKQARQDHALAAGESLHGSYFKDGMEHSRIGVSDGNGFVFISCTGNVSPSGFLPLNAGNIKTSSLKEIYQDSLLFRELRQKDLLKGKCGFCEFKQMCGGSRARAWAETGDHMAAEPRCSYVPPAFLERKISAAL